MRKVFRSYSLDSKTKTRGNVMARKELKQFAFWDDSDEENSYWCIFSSLESAVYDSNGRTIYRFDATPLGKYKMEASLVKIRQRKKKRKRK